MVAVYAEYILHADLDGDRDFDAPVEDLSSYWKDLSWQLGAAEPYEALARSASLQVTLDNRDGRFSPEGAAALEGFQPGALLRLQSRYDGQTHTHFLAWIEAGGIRVAENGLTYGYGDRLPNDLTLTVSPRAPGTAPEVLGTLASDVAIQPGASRSVQVRFDDGSGNRISGLELSGPTFTAVGPSGEDLTASVTATLKDRGTGAEITFRNGTATRATVKAGASVSGLKLTHFETEEVIETDLDSIHDHGRQADRWRLALLDNLGVAAGLARWALITRKAPSGEIAAVSLIANRSDDLMTHALARTIGDRVRVTEAQTGASGTYHIVGEAHEVLAGRVHRAT